MQTEYDQKKNFSISVQEQVNIERDIKVLIKLTNDKINLHQYIIFAKEVRKMMRKYKKDTLFGELKLLDDLWTGRGLDPLFLWSIKKYYLPAYPYGPSTLNLFRLDISLLDGSDVLS